MGQPETPISVSGVHPHPFRATRAPDYRPAPVAAWLLDWLAARETDTLPRLMALAGICPIASSHYTIDAALRLLVTRGMIKRRTGTRSEDRGHGAIRITATGRVFKTSGCPFDPPE